MQDNTPEEHQHSLNEQEEGENVHRQIQIGQDADEVAEDDGQAPLEENENAQYLNVEGEEGEQQQEHFDEQQQNYYEDTGEEALQNEQEVEEGEVQEVEVQEVEEGEVEEGEVQGEEVVEEEEVEGEGVGDGQASSNSPPHYDPDLIDDEAIEGDDLEMIKTALQQAVGEETQQAVEEAQSKNHPEAIREEQAEEIEQPQEKEEQQQYQEQVDPIEPTFEGEATYEADFIEELKIEYEKQSQSEISHVYAEQEMIEEWRDEEVQLGHHDLHVEDYLKNEDYNFAGVNDYQDETIEPPHHLHAHTAEEQRLPEHIEHQAREITIERPAKPERQLEPRTYKSQIVQKTSPVVTSPPLYASKIEGNKQTQKQVDVKAPQAKKVSNQKPTEPKKIASPAPTQKTTPKVQPTADTEGKTEEGSFKKIKASTKVAEKQPQNPVPSKPVPKPQQKPQSIANSPTIKPVAKPSPVREEREVKEVKPDQQRSDTGSNPTKKVSNSNLALLRNQKQVERERQAEVDKKIQQELQQKQIVQNERRREEQRLRLQKQKQRKELQRKQKERIQRERVHKETLERQRQQRERLQKERLQRERLQRERLQRERLQRERLQRERLQRQRIQRERIQEVRRQQERLQKERFERERQQSLEKQPQQQSIILSQQRQSQVNEEGVPPATSHIKVVKKKKKKKANASKKVQNEAEARELPAKPVESNLSEAGSHQPSDDNRSQPRSMHSSALHSERDHASKAHSEIDPSQPGRPQERNIVTEILNSGSFVVGNQAKLPPLTSQVVVREAEKERVGTTYKMFLKYNYEYERTVSTYKRIVRNVCTELQTKKQNKRPLQRVIEDYFEDFARLSREFNDRCYKIEPESEPLPPSKNAFASLRVELKKGFDEMVYLRKAVANNANRLANYVAGTVLPQIRKAFEAYYLAIAQEEGRQLQRREELGRREKQLGRAVSQAEKNFNRGLEGKFKDDLFVQLTRFINEEKLHRTSLRAFGRGVIDLRQTYIRSEKELFDRLQETLDRFKFESQSCYCWAGRRYLQLSDYTRQIKDGSRYAELCTLVDLDYVKYVLELQSKQEKQQFCNRDFENYLELVFFDRVVGNIRDTLKGATNKVFPMQADGDELVHTISGNLVLFHRPNDLPRDHYAIARLNAKIVGGGFVEFDELQKGIFFDDTRTVRLKLRDEDRAEELICYLNEKEQDIVLPPQQ